MQVAICLDDRQGMLFHQRRLSQDRVMRADLLNALQGGKLWLNAYSARQFSAEDQENLCITEDFLDKTPDDAYCFVENQALKPYTERIEKLIVYRWNRVYPSDMRLDLDLSTWNLVYQEDFPGYSHEKITKEIYTR